MKSTERCITMSEGRAAAGRRAQRLKAQTVMGGKVARLGAESQFNTLVTFASSGLPLPLAQRVLGSLCQ